MCETCGCSPPNSAREQEVAIHLLQHNDQAARHNRQHFHDSGTLAINLISSPGAGKTALLEATVQRLRHRHGLAVLEGDLATDLDAQRIRRHGVPAVQITTGGACHLDAQLVHQALAQLPDPSPELLFIENVGNLVCPSAFDLGEHWRVVLLSVTEGDDKVEKHPATFRKADLVLITKADMMAMAWEFKPERVIAALRQLANPAEVFLVSSRTGEGLETWLAWLAEKLETSRV